MKTRNPDKTIDVSPFVDDQSLHAYLATQLGFPSFYGMNWDAFFDCITDDSMSAMPTLLKVKGILELHARLPESEQIFRRCLADYKEEKVDRNYTFE